MKNVYIKTILLLFVAIILFSSCAQPLSADETQNERKFYEAQYSDEPAPSPIVKEMLAFLDSCIGGKYIFGGQGDAITTEYIHNANNNYPDYLSDGRLKFFTEIATESEKEGWDFPEDYAWDCSGLWWDCCNELNFYEEYTDRTAHDTYHVYCTPITKEELRPGDLVFVENDEGRIVHMGIVGQKGYIYEATSGFVGVVRKRTVDKRIYNDIVRGGAIAYSEWNVFGRPIIFE